MKLKSVILCSFLLIFFQLKSQNNIDSLFTTAIEHSKVNEYGKAIDLSESIISIDNNRYDVKIFLANLYAWQNNYVNAKTIIEQVFESNPESNELYDSWLNILLWNQEYNKLLDVIVLAEKNNYKNEFNLSLKRVLAYKELGLYEKGIEYIHTNPSLKDSTQIEHIYDQLYKHKHKNVISVFSIVDYISDDSYQYFGFIDYNRNLGRNNLLIRLNYANRFDTYDFLPELDYYQILSKRDYIYFNLGFGILEELFPKQRAGLEYYTSIKKLGVSLGGRFLNFNNNPVYILTSQVERSFSNYSLALRPYYSFQDQKNSLSVVTSFKVYWKDPVNYSGIQLAYGNSPDENYNNLQDNIALENYWIKLENNFHLSVSSILNVAFRYTYEETTSDIFRNRYSIELLFKQRF